MSQSLKVLHLLDTMQYAGTERHVTLLCGELEHLGVETTIACRPDSLLEAEACRLGLTTLSACDARNPAATVAALARFAKSTRIDVVHGHNGRTMLFAAILHRLTGITAVATQHFLTPQHAQYRGLKRASASLAHRWVNRQVSHVIAVSDAARREMISREGIATAKITTVPNGIAPLPDPGAQERGALRAAAGVAPASLLIVTLARLSAEKGLTFLLDAAPAVLRCHPDARFMLVGDGPQRAELETRARRLGIADAVMFMGFRGDATRLLACADLFVLPSLAEPAGLALIEAMALAVPAVATGAGGPLEIVLDGETGLLVPPGDAAALSKAILCLTGSPALASRMGRSGQERYLRAFTSERMARATREIYQQMRGA